MKFLTHGNFEQAQQCFFRPTKAFSQFNHSLYKYSLQLLHTQVDALLLGIELYTATFLVTLIYLNSAVDAASRGRQDGNGTPQFVFNKRSNKKGKGATFEHCNYSALQGVYCLDRNQMEIHINIYYRAFQIFT